MKKGELILEIDDIFYIIGRGTVVTGEVLCDHVEIEQPIIIDPGYLPEFGSKIGQIETLRDITKSANRNDYVGIVLDSIEKKQVKKGMKIYKSKP